MEAVQASFKITIKGNTIFVLTNRNKVILFHTFDGLDKDEQRRVKIMGLGQV